MLNCYVYVAHDLCKKNNQNTNKWFKRNIAHSRISQLFCSFLYTHMERK